MSYLKVPDIHRIPDILRECDRARWSELEMCVLHVESLQSRSGVLSVNLEFSDDVLTRLESLDVVESSGVSESWVKIPLQELHNRVQPAWQRYANDEYGSILVDTRHVTAKEKLRLVDELVALEGFRVTEWHISVQSGITSGQELRLLRLTPEAGGTPPVPQSLAGHPPILVGDIAGNNYLPPGMVHPLLESFSFLFPPLESGSARFWQASGDGLGKLSLGVMQEEAKPQALLRSLAISTLPIESDSSICRPLEQPLELELRFVRALGLPTDEEQGGDRIFRIDSTDGDLGLSMLSLLDHSEAGLAEVIYFGQELAGGPFGDIRHFALVSPGVEGEEPRVLPHATYFQPRYFAEFNLPVFLREGYRFLPNLGHLLKFEEEDRKQDLLRELRAKLDIAQEGAYALIDPGELVPRVTHLSNGKKLSECAQVITRGFHRDQFSLAKGSLEASAQHTAKEQLESLHTIAAENQESVKVDNRAHLDGLVAFTERINRNYDSIELDLICARDFLGIAEKHLLGLPPTWRGLTSPLVQLFRKLGDGRKAWFDRVQLEAGGLDLSIEANKTLARDLVVEGKRTLKELRANELKLKKLKDAVVSKETEVASLDLTVGKSKGFLEEATKRATMKVEALEKHVGKRETDLTTLTAKVTRERNELQEREDRLFSEEASLATREFSNGQKAKSLSDKQANLNERTSSANSEARRLATLEQEIEGPLADQLQKASRVLSNLQALGLEERLVKINDELRAEKRKAKALKEADRQIVSLTVQIETLKEQRGLEEAQEKARALEREKKQLTKDKRTRNRPFSKRWWGRLAGKIGGPRPWK